MQNRKLGCVGCVGCVGCGDDWLGLTLDSDGLCRTCRAEIANPNHKRIPFCPLCGRRDVPTELHHIASRRQHPTLAVEVCLSCHSILTQRQWSGWDPTWRTEQHPVRFIVQGLLDLLWLWWQRSGRAWSGELLRLVGLAVRALVESCGLHLPEERWSL